MNIITEGIQQRGEGSASDEPHADRDGSEADVEEAIKWAR